MLALLGAALTSVAAIALTSFLVLRTNKEHFYSQLGTDIDQIGFNVELVLAGQSDGEKRRELLYSLLERYMLDDRFSCFKLSIPGDAISVPPEELCTHQPNDRTIRLQLDNEGKSTLIAYVNYAVLDEATSTYLSMTAIVATVILCSFAAPAILLLRERTKMDRQLAERNLNTMLDISPVLMLVLDKNGLIKQLSRGFRQLCADLDSSVSRSINSLFEDTSCDAIMGMIAECSLHTAASVTTEQPLQIRTNHRPGGQLSGALSFSPLASVDSFLLQLTDISSLLEDKQRLEGLLRYDSLTGALSRRALQEVYPDGSRLRKHGILMVDIDYFKSINNAFGHVIGDCYLRHAVQILREILDRESSIFRLSGEEFLVVTDHDNPALVVEQAEDIRAKFAASPLIQDGLTILRTVSIGASILEPDTLMEDIVRIVDRALLKSKSSGKDRVTFLSAADFQAKEQQRPSVEQVEEALINHQIDLHLEQVFDTTLQRIVGFETLLRWQCGGIPIPPMDYLETYYYVTNRRSAGRDRIMILQHVLHRLDPPSLETRPWVSYNIGLPDFESSFLQLLEGIEPKFRALIVLEVSEQLLGARLDEGLIARHLTLLSSMGYRIALDDFGVDGSNLSRLSLFPVDIVKLDKSLIRGIDQSTINQNILRSVRLLSTSLSIEVIAEGVETVEESRMLNDLGIHLHQGFLYGHALPVEQAREALQLHRRACG